MDRPDKNPTPRSIPENRADPPQRTVANAPDDPAAVIAALDALNDGIAAGAEGPILAGRYEDLGRIARGGMGDVRRVWDHALGRALAMKVLPWDMVESERDKARFLAEVRITASLQHPGVVPIHEGGELPDGRLWFTMKEVRGRTLHATLLELHRGVSARADSAPARRRVLEAYLRICETVAYAHSTGVVHCDLKPDNIMIGEFGEVLVMDWGVAKVLMQPSDAEKIAADARLGFPARPVDQFLTESDEVIGTPAYMPPEQARGETSKIGPPSDVYSLGVVLYEILAGKPPFVFGGPASSEALAKRKPPRLPEGTPAELSALVARAMEPDPKDRFADARALVDEMRSWLDGARRRERALAMVAQAQRMLPSIQALRARADALNEEARGVLGSLRSYDPVAEKAKGWRLLEEKEALERQASIEEIAWLQALRSALGEVPDLAEAHEALADHYHGRLVAAEAARDENAATRSEALLRVHDRGRHSAFLRGDGALSLVTDPEGAEVSLYRYVARDRMLVREHVRELGRTPIRRETLARGSYVLSVKAIGCEEINYPVLIGRGEHWDGVRPGDREPTAIRLPRNGELEADSVLVPAGYFIAGGDPEAIESLPRQRLWADAFIARRNPITVAEYLAFLNALVEAGRGDLALAACPRLSMAQAGPGIDALGFAQSTDGRFLPLADAAPEEQHCPVAFVDWHGSMAYAAWLAGETGKPWRLLSELEWEKAARGVDGRFMPWGDWQEATWACMVGSHSGVAGRMPTRAYPTDTSPYGVRGMAGNVRDWCVDAWKQDGPPTIASVVQILPVAKDGPELRLARGGAWASNLCRLASRFAGKPVERYATTGFRLARSLL